MKGEFLKQFILGQGIEIREFWSRILVSSRHIQSGTGPGMGRQIIKVKIG